MDRKGIYTAFLPIPGIKPRALHISSQFEQWVTSPAHKCTSFFFFFKEGLMYLMLVLNLACSLGWSLTLIFLPPGTVDMCYHAWFCLVLGIKPRAINTLDKHSINRVICVLTECFHICSGFRLLSTRISKSVPLSLHLVTTVVNTLECLWNDTDF